VEVVLDAPQGHEALLHCWDQKGVAFLRQEDLRGIFWMAATRSVKWEPAYILRQMEQEEMLPVWNLAMHLARIHGGRRRPRLWTEEEHREHEEGKARREQRRETEARLLELQSNGAG
jgi:hypothetical protein